MRAITICQPWPWAILERGKRVENRTWWSSIRGRVLIHAGKSRQWLGGFGAGEPCPEVMTFGALVGTADMIACVPPAQVHLYCNEMATTLAEQQRFIEGPYCLLMKDVRKFAAPIPYRGNMGWFDVPDELVREAVAGAAACGMPARTAAA